MSEVEEAFKDGGHGAGFVVGAEAEGVTDGVSDTDERHTGV